MILCPSCQAQNRDDAMYCGSCGQACQEKCLLCHKPHLVGTKYCTKDGRDILQTFVAEEAKEEAKKEQQRQEQAAQEAVIKQRRADQDRLNQERWQQERAEFERIKPGRMLKEKYFTKAGQLKRRLIKSAYFLLVAWTAIYLVSLSLHWSNWVCIALMITLIMLTAILPYLISQLTEWQVKRALAIPSKTKIPSEDNPEEWLELAKQITPRPEGCEELLEPATQPGPETLLRPVETNPNTTPVEQLLRPAELKETSDC